MAEQSEKNTADQQQDREREARERGLDKTIADSFPTSDPPSTIPDPGEEKSGSESGQE